MLLLARLKRKTTNDKFLLLDWAVDYVRTVLCSHTSFPKKRNKRQSKKCRFGKNVFKTQKQGKHLCSPSVIECRGQTAAGGGSPRSVKPDVTVLHISSLLHMILVLRSRRVDVGARICRCFGEEDAGVLKVVLQLPGCILQMEGSIPYSASLGRLRDGQNASQTDEFTSFLVAAITNGFSRAFFFLVI